MRRASGWDLLQTLEIPTFSKGNNYHTPIWVEAAKILDVLAHADTWTPLWTGTRSALRTWLPCCPEWRVIPRARSWHGDTFRSTGRTSWTNSARALSSWARSSRRRPRTSQTSLTTGDLSVTLEFLLLLPVYHEVNLPRSVRSFFRGSKRKNVGSGQRALDQSLEQILVNIAWRNQEEENVRQWIVGKLGGEIEKLFE